jgi:hypothetical protein
VHIKVGLALIKLGAVLMKIAYILALVLLTSTAYDRQPQVCFPPKPGLDPNMLSALEKALDERVFPIVSFTDAPVGSVIAWACEDISQHHGIVYIGGESEPNAMVLPPSPETVTLNMTNVTCRTVLNAVCYEAHLSWRLDSTYYMGWPQITLGRPEIFLQRLAIEKRRSESWAPILALLAIGGMFLAVPLFFSLIHLSVREDLATEVLGRKYSYLLDPSLKGYSASLAAGAVVGKVLPIPLDIILAARLQHLMTTDRAAAVKHVYWILVAMGDKVPKDAWREFYKRNPEAKDLECPIDVDL